MTTFMSASAGNGRRAGAAIRLQHIAVDAHGAFPQTLEVDHRPERTSDQALDFLRAARLFAAGRLAGRPRVSCPRQHAVFGGHPALSLAAQKRRHAVFDTGRAQDSRRAEADQHRAFRVLGIAAIETQFAQLVGCAAAGSYAHAARQRSAAALVLSLYGAEASTAWVPRSVSDSRKGLPAVCAKRTKSWSRRFAHKPSVHSSSTSPDLSLRRVDMLISGRAASPPRQHST